MTPGERIDELVARMSGRRTPPVLAGVVLLAVPTLFTVMPQFAEGWHIVLRTVVLVVWLLVAVVSVATAVRRDQRLRAMTDEHGRDQERLRNNGLLFLLPALCHPQAFGAPDHYAATVYLYDNESNRLNAWHPAWDPADGDDVRWFAPGRGATGNAYSTGRTFVVRGAAVANDKYGLREEQQELWKDYRSVASTPIWNEAEATTAIGVVTAISKIDDGHFEGPGQAALRELADALSVVLRFVAHPAGLKGE